MEDIELEVPPETRRLSLVDSHTKLLMSLSNMVNAETTEGSEEDILERVDSQLNIQLSSLYTQEEESVNEQISNF